MHIRALLLSSTAAVLACAASGSTVASGFSTDSSTNDLGLFGTSGSFNAMNHDPILGDSGGGHTSGSTSAVASDVIDDALHQGLGGSFDELHSAILGDFELDSGLMPGGTETATAGHGPS